MCLSWPLDQTHIGSQRLQERQARVHLDRPRVDNGNSGTDPYAGLPSYASKGEAYYDSLQVQVNRHLGRRLQFAADWTWSNKIQYSPRQWIDDRITKNLSDRQQAVNATFAWQLPDGSRVWQNSIMKGLGISTEWHPFNPASVVLPPSTSLGLGNTPPTLTFGPGFENIDLSISKEFRIKERRSLEFRAEAFDALNHFNPSNPNTTLNLNYTTGANTNSTFGVITTAQNLSRRGFLSLKSGSAFQVERNVRDGRLPDAKKKALAGE